MEKVIIPSGVEVTDLCVRGQEWRCGDYVIGDWRLSPISLFLKGSHESSCLSVTILELLIAFWPWHYLQCLEGSSRSHSGGSFCHCPGRQAPGLAQFSLAFAKCSCNLCAGLSPIRRKVIIITVVQLYKSKNEGLTQDFKNWSLETTKLNCN